MVCKAKLSVPFYTPMIMLVSELDQIYQFQESIEITFAQMFQGQTGASRLVWIYFPEEHSAISQYLLLSITCITASLIIVQLQ